MSAAMTLVRDERMPSLLVRPISLPELITGTAAEGTVSITMTDIEGADGSGPADTAVREPDDELMVRFERDAIPLMDQLYGGALRMSFRQDDNYSPMDDVDKGIGSLLIIECFNPSLEQGG